jgi:Tol biopolymer transport system component
MKIYSLLLLFLVYACAFAQDDAAPNHPELEWNSYTTEHFEVHFHQGTFRTASLVGKIAEDIYGPVTTLYNYRPEGKIHFIIRDTDDYSNGGAYFFDNKVEIWAENLDYVLRGTRNWLRDVVTHEFTHMISIQNSIKFSRTFPYGFFQYFNYEPERRKDVVRGFPNVLVSIPVSSLDIPMWFAEGVAQYQAPGAKYDYRDPQREMIVRDRVIHQAFFNFTEMGVFGKTGLGNESAVYNFGYSFVDYLCSRFGNGILEKITENSSRLKVLAFNQALHKATGVPADSLYQQWKDYLTGKYTQNLRVINPNQVKGKLIESDGYANLYPVWSPDGAKIAYTSNKGNDYLSQNKLVVYDRASGEKEIITARIGSSLSWSNNGRYLAFSRITREFWSGDGSAYNNLYIYDLQQKKEIQLTRYLRGRNPDWSSDDSKLIFVAETNGLNQLYVLDLGDHPEDQDWQTVYINRETGKTDNEGTGSKSRAVQYLGKSLQPVLVPDSSRQIYHPRWSPDDRSILFDTATDYGRDIAVYDLADKKFELILAGQEEERYPFYSADGNYIYYTSSRSGIYNLFKLNRTTGARQILTNVTGGAMMADVNRQGELVYSCYDSLGYHLYILADKDTVDPAKTIYEENYLATLPVKDFNDQIIPEREIRPYKTSFTGLHLLPRLLIDYGTVKPGLYMVANDVLDKMSLFAAADVNNKFDFDLYGGFEYRNFFPTLFMEAYNLNANIADTFSVATGRQSEIVNQDINFNLTEVQLGAQFEYPAGFNWRTAFVLSIYNATIQWFDPFYQTPITFRYRYLNGRSWQVQLQIDRLRLDRFRDISPGGGRYLSLFYALEWNDFLIDFDTGTGIGAEVFKLYHYQRAELDWEEYFSNPLLRSHTFSARLRAGYIDRSVDDFFHLFAGGFVGMKGYSYYSIEGTRKVISTFTYRLPIMRNINRQFANLYFDKLYLGMFYDYGNAWIKDKTNFNQFKQDIGIQLRLECFASYMFPTKIFWEAVYPLEKVQQSSVVYKQDWRFYFGILFTFDVRERNRFTGYGIPNSLSKF